MGLCLLPLAAGVLLLECRPQQARKLFAAALLCEGVAWAGFCFLVGWSVLSTGLTGLSLLLAGSGQFVAAFRSPRTYAVALGFATGAVLVIVAGPIGERAISRLDLPPEWLNPPPSPRSRGSSSSRTWPCSGLRSGRSARPGRPASEGGQSTELSRSGSAQKLSCVSSNTTVALCLRRTWSGCLCLRCWNPMPIRVRS